MHIAKIDEKLESYPSGVRQYWALSKTALGNFSQPLLPGRSLCLELDFG